MSNEDFELTKLNYQEDDSAALKEKINNFLESTFFNIFITVVTVWALFGDDIRVIAVTKESDVIFSILTIIVFVVFCVEVFLSSYATQDYIYGFYFWLDIISTASLLLDIGWISDVIFQTGGGAGGGQSAASIAKAARASRIGTRAARVIRIIRLIRLIRIIKLYKQAEKAEQEKAEKKAAEADKHRGSSYNEGDEGIHRSNSDVDVNKRSGQGQNDEELDSEQINQVQIVDGKVVGKNVDMADLLQETNVGKKLGAKTNKIVIILILSIMMTIPLFGTDTYTQEDNEYEGMMKGLSMHLASIALTASGTPVPIVTATVDPIFRVGWNR